jgi:hypothetical protein
MSLFKTSLKESAWFFLLSRCIILVVSYLAVILIPQFGSGLLQCTRGIYPNPCLLVWDHWDASAYARMGFQGYAFSPDVAFFPLWPLIVHFGGLMLGGSNPVSYYLAGLLFSNLFFFFTLVLFYCLLAEEFEPSVAKKALFYLSFYPYAIFFFAGYSESLFLLLGLGVFLFLRLGRTLDWWFAGALGFLAALTRSAGVLLAIPFLVVYIQRFWLPSQRSQSSFLQKLNAFVPIILLPAAVVVYMAYLGYAKGNPFIAQSFEWSYWHRHFALIWHAFGPVLKTFIHSPVFSLEFVKNGLDLTFTIVPIIALILGWKRLPLHYNLFAVAIILFSLSFPLDSINSLASQPRYMMTAFPAIVIFALWGKRTRFDQAYVAIAITMLVLNTVLFVAHYWVA